MDTSVPGDGEPLSPESPTSYRLSQQDLQPQMSTSVTGIANAESAVSLAVDPSAPPGQETEHQSILCEIVTSMSSCCGEPEEPPVTAQAIPGGTQRAMSISSEDLDEAHEQSQRAVIPGRKSLAAEVSVLIGSSEGQSPASSSRASRAASTSITSSVSSASSPSALLGSSSTSPRSHRTFTRVTTFRPVSMDEAQAVVASDGSAMYGLVPATAYRVAGRSTASESGSQQPLVPVVLAPAEQELLSGAGGVAVEGFFDFTWDAPEEGWRRSFGMARPDRASSAGSGGDVGRFSWSSDAMRRAGERSSGRGWGSSRDLGTYETYRGRGSSLDRAASETVYESSQAESFAGESSAVPVAMETNLLHSDTATSEDAAAAAYKVDEVNDVWENQENLQDEEIGQEGEFIEMVPVMATENEDQVEERGIRSASEASHASVMEADPETGVVRAVQSAPPGPTGPPPKAAVSPQIAELIEEQKLKADKEADQMDKEMRDVELTSVELFPESRLVILLALLCILWILFLILTAAVKHGVRPGCDTTTSAGGGSHDHDHSTEPPTESDETSPSGPPAGPTGSTSPTGPVGPTGSTRSTEKPLSDVYICYTEYCKKEGEYLGSLTSKSSKRACDDFYEYVCEAWKKYATPLRDNQPGAAVSTDTLLQRAMEDRLLAYIKDPTHADVTPARTMHELCTNRADADAVLLSAKELFRSWGYEWPRTASSGGTPDDVWRFAGKLLRVLGIPSIVGVEIGLEPRDLDKTIIEVGPPKGTIFYAKDVSNHRVMALFTDAVKSAVQELIPQDPAAANAAGTDVSIALAALSLLHLDDLGTSPLDFEVDSFGALGKGVQAFMGVGI
ncbi:hypothetical protein MRX96_046196 [Rhipicephalus microplus]